VAVSSDGARWFVINASPNLGAQIESLAADGFPATARPEGPLEAILLTNADLDHTLGLFLLREGGPLIIHATAAIRETLGAALRLEDVLQAFCGVSWREPVSEFSPLRLRSGVNSGLSARVFDLPASRPSFAARTGMSAESGHSVAWQIRDDTTGARALIAPHVSRITEPLRDAMQDSQAVLFDGTFWSDDELQRVKPGARTARQMGHVPVSESWGALASLRARPRVLIHINNTNPILAPGSPERRIVEESGIIVGEDGLEYEL